VTRFERGVLGGFAVSGKRFRRLPLSMFNNKSSALEQFVKGDDFGSPGVPSVEFERPELGGVDAVRGLKLS